MRIALLEDDSALAELMVTWLEDADHSCDHYATCATFLRALHRETFDLLIVDWELPDGSGLEVTRTLRGFVEWRVPVLFVTNRAREDDIVQALQAGADDYMVKPVKQREMLARVQALARRALGGQETAQPLTIGPYHIDPMRQIISYEDKPLTVTDKEFELALFLFRNLGRLLSRGHLMQTIWGLNNQVSTRTLDTHVSSIRKKLDIRPENGFRIKTVYRHGYRLEKVDDD